MDDIISFCSRFDPCGSRITCSPPPTDTDEDFLLLVPAEKMHELEAHLLADGWSLGGSEIPDECNIVDEDSRFQSYTRGEKNLIITHSNIFYRRFMAATHVCKRLNLMDKNDRVALFQAVLYANVVEI